jgi:EmrB/QacA subfamily drug resistance transporter
MSSSVSTPPRGVTTTVNGVQVRGTRPVRPGLVITVFCLGLFMTLLDITIVNIAIPDLVTDLAATFETVLWVTSAYSLVYTVMLIVFGRLGDIVGPRRMFLLGISLFTAASLASGLAQNPSQLVAFRALQGLGAAMLAPQALPLITSVLPVDKRGPAFAATGIVAGLGILLGPTLGGLLVTNAGWRWIFFLNVPIGVVVIVLAFATMPDVRPGVPHRLDLPGVALLTVGLFGVVFGLIEGDHYDWGTVFGGVTIWEIIGAGALVLVLFGWHQVRMQDREPLVPFDIFHDRTYTVMTVVMLLLGFAMVGVFLPLTIYYQSVLGLSAVSAGLVIGVQSLASMITSGIVGANADRLPLKWVLFAGLLLFAVGIGYITLIAQPDSNRWTFLPGLILAGVGMGCAWTPLFGLATEKMAPARAGVAAGVLDTMQEFGTVLATAILGAVLANRIGAAMPGQIEAAAETLPGAVQQPFVDGMSQVAGAGAEVGAGQAASIQLPPGVPADLADQVRQAAQQAFSGAFTDAMKPTMIAPVVLIVVGAALVLLVRNHRAPLVADVELVTKA